MIFGRRKQLFVSYSSEDEQLVKPIVKLLRLMRGGAFWAPDSIVAGTQWNEAIKKAIKSCRLVVVFWCSHSSNSKWVDFEWRYAESQRKPIVPVFLDGTAIPTELSKYQGFPFVGTTAHDINGFQASSQVNNAWREGTHQAMPTVWTGTLVGLVLVVLSVLRPFPWMVDWLEGARAVVNAVVLIVGICLAGIYGWVLLRSRLPQRLEPDEHVQDQIRAVAARVASLHDHHA